MNRAVADFYKWIHRV